MDQKEVLTNLGRVKAYYNKGNTIEALNHMVLALSDVARTPSASVPTSLRSSIREAVQLLARDSVITEGLKNPIMYKPGEEKKLLSFFYTVYKRLVEGPKETREETKARKQKIDKAYLMGLKLLEANKISEADQVFQEAIKYFKDEIHLYKMISTALINAGQNVRASGYLKKAVTLKPDNQELQDMLAKIKEA